jgi:hypothetical protein
LDPAQGENTERKTPNAEGRGQTFDFTQVKKAEEAGKRD